MRVKREKRDGKCATRDIIPVTDVPCHFRFYLGDQPVVHLRLLLFHCFFSCCQAVRQISTMFLNLLENVFERQIQCLLLFLRPCRYPFHHVQYEANVEEMNIKTDVNQLVVSGEENIVEDLRSGCRRIEEHCWKPGELLRPRSPSFIQFALFCILIAEQFL